MSDESAIPVFLLKTRSTPRDGYAEHFGQSSQYRHVFVPVLEHSFRADVLDDITNKIVNGVFSGSADVSKPYGGIIFTSQRAAEAFIRIVETIRPQRPDLDQLLPASLPLYVVGPATGRSLSTLKLACPVIGDHTGNGESLAAFMLQDYNQRRSAVASDAKPGLLFLVGEQRRDIIPKTLTDPSLPSGRHIAVDELTVYETGVMQSFPEAFAHELHAAPTSAPARWVVVFSPTGCEAMLRVLGMLDSATGKVVGDVASSAPRTTKIVTIGPTTRDYLIRNFDFEPDACAEKPTPEGVVAAIEAATGP